MYAPVNAPPVASIRMVHAVLGGLSCALALWFLVRQLQASPATSVRVVWIVDPDHFFLVASAARVAYLLITVVWLTAAHHTSLAFRKHVAFADEVRWVDFLVTSSLVYVAIAMLGSNGGDVRMFGIIGVLTAASVATLWAYDVYAHTAWLIVAACLTAFVTLLVGMMLHEVGLLFVACVVVYGAMLTTMLFSIETNRRAWSEWTIVVGAYVWKWTIVGLVWAAVPTLL